MEISYFILNDLKLKRKIMKKLLLMVSLFFISIFTFAQKPQLIFKSGFEPNTATILDTTGQRIKDFTGEDLSTGYDWESDLEADGRNFSMNYVDYTGGQNPDMLGSRIVVDPTDSSNHILYCWQKDAEWQEGGFWSRVQGEITNINWVDVRYNVRFRLDSSIALANGESCDDLGISLFEVGGSPGFHLTRIKVFKWGSNHKGSDGKDPLTFRAEVRTPEKNHIFFESCGVEPKYGVWQELEFYAKASAGNDGHYTVKIDDEVLFDTTLQTKDKGYWEKVWPLKFYCGNLVKFLKEKGVVSKLWFDDVEIWATPYREEE